MKQRRPDDVIRRSADADPMSKTIIGPMKLSVIGPMKHPSRARHRADEVVLVGKVPKVPVYQPSSLPLPQLYSHSYQSLSKVTPRSFSSLTSLMLTPPRL